MSTRIAVPLLIAAVCVAPTLFGMATGRRPTRLVCGGPSASLERDAAEGPDALLRPTAQRAAAGVITL
ncbi:hypothetical protein Pla175_34270 [Pirellulimonas nuda]|uniref:Uncharacterized protein n=1 Tax=Pirellulimonas nuda TaxID=2528009 RepID=A0A518DEX5_9BACT|nr:hypothetical protein [Pirellulimonas nuda]QDU90028.1 hypothetical protein Pla175_34270 [Pirellulimonas nuda]